MKKLLPLLLFLACGSASAQVLSIYCNAATQTACNTTTPYSGSSGDAWWLAFGKDNANTDYLCGALGICTSNGGLVIGSATGGAKGVGTINAIGLYVNGVAVGGGSMVYPGAGIPNSTGTAWGTSYSTTGTGNVVLSTSPALVTPNLGTPSAINLSNATSLPCAATPALNGDVTTSAGSCTTTVSKVNGASIPASAALTATNASSQFTPITLGAGFSITSGTLNYSGGGVTLQTNGTNNTSQTTLNLQSGNGVTVANGSAGNVSVGLATQSNNTILGNNSGSSAAPTGLTPAQTIGVLNSGSANAQTGTTYTLALTDANLFVTMNNAAANTLCVPPNSTVAFPVGTQITVEQLGAGTTTVAPAGASGCAGTGVTLDSVQYGSSTSQTYALAGAYDVLQIKQTATNVWLVTAVGPGRAVQAGTANLASAAFGGVSGILPVANGGSGTSSPGLVAGTNVTITGSWPNQTIAASGGSSTPTDVQVFTASGTWTKPSGTPKVTTAWCLGGGGGGGSGAFLAASTAGSGGGGGGGGAAVSLQFATSSLPATISVTVGTGGTGGAAVTAAGSGNNGGNGNNSTFGTYLTAYGGGYGQGGASGAATNGGGSGGLMSNGGAQFGGAICGQQGGGGTNGKDAGCAGAGGSGGGDASTGSAGAFGGHGYFGGGGAGSGGGLTSADATSAGGAGGAANNASGGSAGTAGGGTGGAGGAPTGGAYASGGAGGGGGSSSTGAAGAGGAGSYGSGGGGGGASTTTSSGAGGNGGNGECVVTTTY